MTNPKVSVIVAIYNREKYLRKCVESICAQTLHEIEIILVDDGSTDNSPAICDEYAARDSRVRVIHKENAGMGVANNIGMKSAKGKYIGFVETDDWIEPEMYESLYDKAVEQDVDVVKSLYTEIREGKKPKVHNKFKLGTLNRKIADRFQIREFVIGCVSHWSAIYRREFILDEHILFPCTSGASYQDVGFNWQVFVKMHSCYVLPLSFYNYQLSNPTSSINQAYRSAEMILQMQIWIQDWSKRENVSDKLTERRKKNVFIELYYRCIMNKVRCRGVGRLKFTLKVSKLFRECLPGLQFVFFSPREKEEYIRICKHPFLHFLWNSVCEKKSGTEQNFVRFCGIRLYEKRSKQGKTSYRMLGIPYRKEVKRGTITQYFFLGVPYASDEKQGNLIIKRLFGMRYKIIVIAGR